MPEFRIIKFLRGYTAAIKEPFTIRKLTGALFSTARSTSFISYQLSLHPYSLSFLITLLKALLPFQQKLISTVTVKFNFHILSVSLRNIS